MAPRVIPAVPNVPITVDLWRVGTGGGPFIGEINTVDRQLYHVPGVDKGAEVAGLPAERARPVFGKRRRDRGIYRTAGRSAASARGGSARRGADQGRRAGRGAATAARDGSGEAVDREANAADPRLEAHLDAGQVPRGGAKAGAAGDRVQEEGLDIGAKARDPRSDV